LAIKTATDLFSLIGMSDLLMDAREDPPTLKRVKSLEHVGVPEEPFSPLEKTYLSRQGSLPKMPISPLVISSRDYLMTFLNVPQNIAVQMKP
jgi:hypothetical protein